MTHCLWPYTTVPWPHSHRILCGFPPEERAWGGHSAPLHRAVPIPHPASSPGLGRLPTLCLRLPGESQTANWDAGFQQQSSVFKRCIFSLSALLLCVVFKIGFGFGFGLGDFLGPSHSSRSTCQQVFVQRKTTGGWGGGRKWNLYHHLIHHQVLLISHKHLCPTSAKEKKVQTPLEWTSGLSHLGSVHPERMPPFSHLLPGKFQPPPQLAQPVIPIALPSQATKWKALPHSCHVQAYLKQGLIENSGLFPRLTVSLPTLKGSGTWERLPLA